MRSQEQRFVGNARTWQIFCAQCGKASKPIKSAAGHSVAPKGIVKKLTQMHWIVGNNEKQDRCPECVRKPAKSHISVAAKALHDMQAPVVPVNGGRVHFTELKAAAGALNPEHAKELIEVLRQQLPPKPPKKPKAEPPPKMEQADYENWLSTLSEK